MAYGLTEPQQLWYVYITNLTCASLLRQFSTTFPHNVYTLIVLIVQVAYKQLVLLYIITYQYVMWPIAQLSMAMLSWLTEENHPCLKA